MKPRSTFLALLLCLCACSATVAQRIAMEGLRASHGQGSFHGLRADTAGNLYTLFDAHDGIHLLKLNAAGTDVLGSADIGSSGDTGLALDLDSTGAIYITGTTSTQGSLQGTAGTSFPNHVDASIDGFVARFTPDLHLSWITFSGSTRTVPQAIAVTTDGNIVIAGSIFSATLPATSSALQSQPASGTTGNGFLESFLPDGTLRWATYLSGTGGDTTPVALAPAAAGGLYIAGSTNASGFPTINALVPRMVTTDGNTTSGFLTCISAGGDSFLFSTYVPGNGLSSLAVDAFRGNIAVAGDIAPGLFPLTSVPAPFAVGLPYQTAAIFSADGSAVSASTLLAPGLQSQLAFAGDGHLWAAVGPAGQTLPVLLPAPAFPEVGDAALFRLTSAGVIDRAFRLGGSTVDHAGYASIATEISALFAGPAGATVAGSVAPTLSADLLGTQRYDLPLVLSPNAALPSSVRDALPSNTCTGSLCSGSAALLAQVEADGTAPALAISSDPLPRVVLRNAAASTLQGLGISSGDFNVETACPPSLFPGDECDLALFGSGPGNVLLFASQIPASLLHLPTSSGSVDAALSVVPSELRFGIVSSDSSPTTATLTVANSAGVAQSFTSRRIGMGSAAYALTEISSDCPTGTAPATRSLAPGASCHIVLALAASAPPANDGPVLTRWQVGSREIAVSGYTQSAALSLSAARIDFGLRYTGGPESSRFLFLANSSDHAQPHSAVLIPAASTFTLVDACPALLQAHSVCRMQIAYQPGTAISADSLSLNIDGLPVVLSGEVAPPPALRGSSAGASLALSTNSVRFINPVPVTTPSSESQLLTVTNRGPQPAILDLATTGDFTATPGCVQPLSASATCTISLAFAPSAPGVRSGLLSISAVGGAPAYVSLSGDATTITPAASAFLDFGAVPTGTPAVQWIPITQSFRSLGVQASPSAFGTVIVEDTGFGHGNPPISAFSSTAGGSCLHCFVGVQFLPAAEGAQAGTLTLTSSASGDPQQISLSGNTLSVSGLSVTPSGGGFGAVPLGTSTAPRLLTLTNASAAAVTLGTPAITGDFTVDGAATGAPACSGTLPRNGSCQIGVLFRPSALGPRTGQLTLSGPAGDVTAALSGFGIAAGPLTASSLELHFRNIPDPSATQQTLTLINTGAYSESFSPALLPDPHFLATSLCTVLAPGQSCQITVTFTPGDAQVKALLTVPFRIGQGEAASNLSLDVPVTGQYTAGEAGLEITPGSLADVDFGSGTTGRLASTRLLHVTNLSSQPLTLQVEAARQFPILNSTCNSLVPGGSCDLAVSFLPVLNGEATGTAFITGTASDGSVVAHAMAYLRAYGEGSGHLTVTDGLAPGGLLDFGQVVSGQGLQRTLTLTNTGTGIATPHRIHAEFPFSMETTCGLPLAPGESCTLNVTYAPLFLFAAGGAPQNDAGVVTIEADSTDAPIFVDLAGHTSPASAVAESAPALFRPLLTSAGSLSFADTGMGTSSPPQTLTLTNGGNAPFHIASLRAPAGFSAATLCDTLAAGASCAVQITFSPPAQGVFSGTLEIWSDSDTPLEYVLLTGSSGASSISLQPQSLGLGIVLVGATSQALSAVLANDGSASVTLGAIASSSAEFSIVTPRGTSSPCGPPGTALAAGSACTIALAFSPASASPRIGTLSVATSAAGEPITVALSGTGALPQIYASQAALDFGDVSVSKTSTLSLTLANRSEGPVDSLRLHLAGSGAFSLSSDCNTVLTAGSSCAVNIRFAPSAPGPETGSVILASSDLASPLTVALLGRGIAAPVPLKPAGALLLTVNGGSSVTASTRSGVAATLAVVVAPVAGFTGAVAVTCTAVTPASDILCSPLPPTMTLAGGPQSGSLTISTGTAAALGRPRQNEAAGDPRLLCLTLPGAALLALTRRRRRRSTPVALLLIVGACAGCGGRTSSVHYATPGTYRFVLTASSVDGSAMPSSVTVDVTVTPR